jgi:predicted molibdopterin-dependent oxidoreductase YjgC
MTRYRVVDHPILGPAPDRRVVNIFVDGVAMAALEGEPIAAALLAHGIRAMRRTPKFGEPRGVFCAIGRCTDCVMTVDGVPNVRTCVTPVREGMKIRTQTGLGEWGPEVTARWGEPD